MNMDKKVLDLIKEIDKRKKEIAYLEKPDWKTNCSFSYSENDSSKASNLKVESSIKNLLLIAGFLMRIEKDYQEAASNLQVEPESLTWQGFSIQNWLFDIKTRINKLQISSKRDKLEQLEKRLNAIISPELKAQLELEAIENELK